jgi:hypothetical protein
MIHKIEIMQDYTTSSERETAHNNFSNRLRQTDEQGIRISECIPDQFGRSAVNKKRTEVKPMMQFKRGMMIVVQDVRTSQYQQKQAQTTQKKVSFSQNTSGTVRRVQDTQRRYKRGMMIITPIENEQ